MQPGRTRIARSTPLLGGVSSSGPNGWSFLAVVGIYVATPCFQNHPLSNSRIYLGGSRGLINDFLEVNTRKNRLETDLFEFPLPSLTSLLPSLSRNVCPLSPPLCQPQYYLDLHAQDRRGRFVCPTCLGVCTLISFPKSSCKLSIFAGE